MNKILQEQVINEYKQTDKKRAEENDKKRAKENITDKKEVILAPATESRPYNTIKLPRKNVTIWLRESVDKLYKEQYCKGKNCNECIKECNKNHTNPKCSTITFDNLNLSAYSHQALDYLLIIVSKKLARHMSRDEIIKISEIDRPISEWLEICGLQNQTKSLHTLNTILNSLQCTMLTWQGKQTQRDEDGNVIFIENKKHKLVPLEREEKCRCGIIDTITESKGRIKVRLSLEFLYHIADYGFIMDYPEGILAINTRENPNSYYFANKIYEHNKINKSKNNANSISVRSLIEASPVFVGIEDIPRPAMFKERVLARFERDMNELILKDVIKGWCYTLNNVEYNGKITSKVFYDLGIRFKF